MGDDSTGLLAAIRREARYYRSRVKSFTRGHGTELSMVVWALVPALLVLSFSYLSGIAARQLAHVRGRMTEREREQWEGLAHREMAMLARRLRVLLRDKNA